MKRLTLLLGAIFIFLGLKAQYYQFSQYNFTNQRVNPGAISLSDYAQAGFIYRNQETLTDLKLKSFAFSAIYPLIANSKRGRWSSVGLSLGKDETGMGGLFVVNDVGLLYAVNFNVAKNQQLSFGAKINYQARRINAEALFTGSQYIPGYGFELNIATGEDFTRFNADFISYSAGLVWEKKNKKGQLDSRYGLSAFDFNRPNESMLKGHSLLPLTWVIEGQQRLYENKSIVVYPTILYTYSTLTSALNIGVVTTFSLSDYSASLNGLTGELHTKYLLNEGVMVGVQFKRDAFRFGISYDIPMHGITAHQGALEVAAEVNKLISRKFKKSKQKDRKQKETKTTPKKNKQEKISINKDEDKKEVKDLTEKVASDLPEKKLVEKEQEESLNDSLGTKKEKDITANLSEPKVKASFGPIKHEALLLESTKLVYYFNVNDAEAGQSAIDYLTELIQVLEEDKLLKIKVIGHSDNVGNEEYNLTLSKKRADIIRDFLVRRNISGNRIVTYGKGESEPLNDNSTEEKRRLNRRVEVIFYY